MADQFTVHEITDDAWHFWKETFVRSSDYDAAVERIAQLEAEVLQWKTWQQNCMRDAIPMRARINELEAALKGTSH